MGRVEHLDRRAFVKYLCALLLFGLNGIVANRIALNSYEIVFLRTLIGSALLILIYLFGKGGSIGRSTNEILRLSSCLASRWVQAGCSCMRHISRSVSAMHLFFTFVVRLS